MLNRILLGTLVFLCALAMVAPASAVTVNNVHYVILAKSSILMENSADCDPLPANTLGCMIINGNVGVSDLLGTLKIGSHNIINGTAAPGDFAATAHSIIFGSFSQVAECRFDLPTAGAPAGVCAAELHPLPAGVLPIVAAWPPGPLGTPTFPVGCNPNTLTPADDITVPAGGTSTPDPLPPGCYRDVRVNSGGVLNLAVGAYGFRNLRLIFGSTLGGATLNGAGSTLTKVTVANLTQTEQSAKINSVTIQTPGTVGFSVTEFIKISNSNTLTDVVLYAPTSGIHLNTGLRASTGFEAVANVVTVEPSIIENGVELECGCFGKVTHDTTSVTIDDGTKLTDAIKFFLTRTGLPTTCNPAVCPGLDCLDVTGDTTVANDQTATIDTTGLTSGTYQVLGQWTAGTFCHITPVTVP